MLTYALVGIMLLVYAAFLLFVIVRPLAQRERLRAQADAQRQAFRDAQARIDRERARLRGLVEISRNARARIQ
jgi:hypothetical protein